MILLFGAMISLILIWAFLSLVFIGIGLLFHRICSSKTIRLRDWLDSFWIGWALTIIFLQFWHLFFKVDGSILVLISLFGLLGLAISFKEIRLFVKKNLAKD